MAFSDKKTNATILDSSDGHSTRIHVPEPHVRLIVALPSSTSCLRRVMNTGREQHQKEDTSH